MASRRSERQEEDEVQVRESIALAGEYLQPLAVAVAVQEQQQFVEQFHVKSDEFDQLSEV